MLRDRNGLPKGPRLGWTVARGGADAVRSEPLALEVTPSVVRIERLDAEQRGVRVVLGRLVGDRRLVRFAVAATHPVAVSIRPRAEIAIAFRAEVERLVPAQGAGGEGASAALSAVHVARWADRAWNGDRFARRLVARTARDIAALCRAGGPSRLLVALDAIEPGASGPDRARYFVRGPLSMPPGARRRAGGAEGILDAGPLRMALDPPPLSSAASGADGAWVEGVVRLFGLPPMR